MCSFERESLSKSDALNNYVTASEPAVLGRYTDDEDVVILRMRMAGKTFGQIAAKLCRSQQSVGQRYSVLRSRSAQNEAAERFSRMSGQHLMIQQGAIASKRLLARQIKTGQFNGAARAAWVARHGDAA